MKNFIYETTDLALAATLYISFELMSIDRADPRRVIFVFEAKAEIDKLIEDFWNKRYKVDALTYFSALKTLKSRIYEQ